MNEITMKRQQTPLKLVPSGQRKSTIAPSVEVSGATRKIC